jgi:hypothetical protein
MRANGGDRRAVHAGFDDHPVGSLGKTHRYLCVELAEPVQRCQAVPLRQIQQGVAQRGGVGNRAGSHEPRTPGGEIHQHGVNGIDTGSGNQSDIQLTGGHVRSRLSGRGSASGDAEP